MHQLGIEESVRAEIVRAEARALHAIPYSATHGPGRRALSSNYVHRRGGKLVASG